MKHLRDNKGFTLIELVVSIASASLVFAAASMLLLLCMRTQRDVYNVAREQRTSRVVLSMLENLASDGTIRKVETTPTGWNLLSEDDQNVLTYSVVEKALILHGEELLDGIRTAHAELNGQMLTFSFETAENSYSTSVYCRLLPKPAASGEGVNEEKLKSGDVSSVLEAGKAGAEDFVDGTTQRQEFIKVLCNEYGSTGRIMAEGADRGITYAQWYEPSWPEDTPWCGCYLNWAAAVSEVEVKNLSNVSEAWKKWDTADRKDRSYYEQDLLSGDFIFFDWEALTGEYDPQGGPNTPDHVGVVIYIDRDRDTIYTIEGNSGGRVAIRSYHKDDPRILGYGTW